MKSVVCHTVDLGWSIEFDETRGPEGAIVFRFKGRPASPLDWAKRVLNALIVRDHVDEKVFKEGASAFAGRLMVCLRKRKRFLARKASNGAKVANRA
jgi:hypothetical protein